MNSINIKDKIMIDPLRGCIHSEEGGEELTTGTPDKNLCASLLICVDDRMR